MFVWQADHSAAPSPHSTTPPPPPSLPPRFPDCMPCGKFGGCACPSKRKRANHSNSNLPSDLYGEGPVLKGCTWSVSCQECALEPEGKLDACRRQWAKAEQRQHAWRRARIFLGGDWLSIFVPLGLGGPKNKQLCMVCLASLHDTNAAGVPHLPSCPIGGQCPF
eukprot:6199215-Pleurochrysis_carterae.AAC.1